MKRYVRVFLMVAVIATPIGAARAATITVAPGEVMVSANGLCSLREAIANAESDSDTSSGDCVAGSGTDTIALAAGSTYSLPDAVPTVDPNYGESGLPAINTAIVIDGNGATIERDSSLFSGAACSGAGAKFRIVHVAPSGDLTLNNLTMRYGCANFGFRGAGGAIFNRGTVSANDTIVTSSQAGYSAGAIQNDGTMTLTRSTVSNSATTIGAGGAIVNTGTLNVVQSTIDGNQTPGAGGGIDNTRGSAQLANSTLSGNSSAGNGGGVFNVGTSVTFKNATVAANHGTSIAAAATPGSGLYVPSGTVTLSNTLLALQAGGSNCFGLVSSANSLADDGSCIGAASIATPLIAALADNGGPTLTHALVTGSPAIDAGNNATCSSAPIGGIDQRGIARPQFGATSNTCDIGAYEALASLAFTGGVSAAEGAAGTTTFTFTISRGGATSGVATVQVDTADGTATAGSDYTAIVAQTVTIPDGASTATVSVTVAGDTVAEANETFTVNLSNPVNATISGASATGTILNDDTPGATVSPTSGLITTEAGGAATFTVVLDTQPSADVTIGVASSDATEGTAAPASLTFTSANWNVPQTVTVTGVDDGLADGNQAYTIVTSATSADALYNGVAVADVAATNVDDETAASDNDGDGISGAVENAGPNGGDGNGDGIPDSGQPSVTTLPRADGAGYLTIVSSCPLRNVTAIAAGALPTSQQVFPFGLVEFRLPCAAANMTILYHGATSWNPGIGYWKYGPRTPGVGGTTAWYQLPGVTFDTTTVGGATVARASFSLADGALGDDTGVDGVIFDQGGPGAPAGSPAPVPTLSEWMLGLLALLLLGAGMHRGRIRT